MICTVDLLIGGAKLEIALRTLFVNSCFISVKKLLHVICFFFLFPGLCFSIN